jgi:hypothetical protein
MDVTIDRLQPTDAMATVPQFGPRMEIRRHGKTLWVPWARIDGATVISTGQWLKTASLHDEELVEGDAVSTPASFIARLRDSPLRADIFTFAQKVPDVAQRHAYHVEWDNAAVVAITSYAEWFEKKAQYDVRKAVKKAHKLGVVVREAQFDDALVKGICGVYNESAVRQGTAFWHYQKEFDVVKMENATYLDRSAFIGAYFQDELIGFIKMVYVDKTATTLQVISQKKHFDKKPMNALIAKAVEICEQRGVSHLIYGSYTYDGHVSSLTEFKRRNGFEQVLIPRYYAPLSKTGELALRLNVHHGLRSRLPKSMIARARKIRSLSVTSLLESLRHKNRASGKSEKSNDSATKD